MCNNIQNSFGKAALCDDNTKVFFFHDKGKGK